MDNIGKQYCMLCLSLVSDENLNKIETKDILNVLLLKLDFSRSGDVMCNVCSLKVMEAVTFKSMCLYTENTIISYVNNEAECCVDLKEIYAKEKGNGPPINNLHNSEVCRLCMQLINGEFMRLYEVEVDVFEKYIPEMNLSVTEDPIICKECFASVNTHSSFIKNCSEVEEKIKCDYDSNGPFSFPWIKLEEGECKEECAESEFTVEESKAEKQDLIKTECVDIKSEYGGESDIPLDVSSNMSTHEDIVPKRKKTSRKEVHQCGRCGYNTSVKKNLEIHQSIHGEVPRLRMYKCDKCSYTTVHKSNLTRHGITHMDPSEVKIFKCDVCSFETKLKSILIGHMLTHKKSSDMQMYKCIYCSFETKYHTSMKNHIFTHEGKDLLNPNEALKIKDMLRLVKPLVINKFSCEICDFTTMNKLKFSEHQLQHKGEKPHKCDECDYKALRKYSIKVHQKLHHSPSEVHMYKCDTCDYKVIDKYRLRKHQLTHKNAAETQMHKCLYCDCKTKYKTSMKNHIVFHHKDVLQDPEENLKIKRVFKLKKFITVKMYKCDKCDYETLYKQKFVGHQTMHGTGRLRFECKECSYATMYYSSFAAHLVTHRDPSEIQMYKCDMCDFETKHKRNVEIHQLTHKNVSKEEMYRCDKCSYVNKYKRNFVRHQLRHMDPSQVKMYRCDKCDYQVKSKKYLPIHMAKHKETT